MVLGVSAFKHMRVASYERGDYFFIKRMNKCHISKYS